MKIDAIGNHVSLNYGKVIVEFDNATAMNEFLIALVKSELAVEPVVVPPAYKFKNRYDGEGIEMLDLSVRSYNCLKRAGINYLGEIKNMTINEISAIRNMNSRSIDEIREKMLEIYEQLLF